MIVEDGFTAALAGTYETLFTTGNGYVGTRGSLLKAMQAHRPGPSCAVSLITTTPRSPTWSRYPPGRSLAVVAGGVRLDVTSASVVRHRRTGHAGGRGVPRHHVRGFRGPPDRVETVHFASSAAQHLCCLRARITPENHTAPVIVRSGIDGTGYNLDRRPIYAEPPPDDPQMKWHKWARSRHLDEVAREHLPDGIYLETRTIDTGITIGYAALTRALLVLPSPASSSGTNTSSRWHTRR